MRLTLKRQKPKIVLIYHSVLSVKKWCKKYLKMLDNALKKCYFNGVGYMIIKVNK